MTPPVIASLPSDIVRLPDQPDGATAVVSWQPPTASDDVGVTSLTSTHQPGDTFSFGTTTVTYTASDADGNVATASFSVTVMSLELWRLNAFGSEIFDESISADDSNPDGDMWSNLAEYALGLDPQRWDGDAQVSLSLGVEDLEFHLYEIPERPDVVLTIESLRPPDAEWVGVASLAPNSDWEYNPSELQISSEPEGNPSEITVTKAIQGSHGEFLRVSVNRASQP